uniref:Uncharacterized protein n=1 Tax=Anguilla anguilla TaxID=7936 RepID=A0A0E9QJD6_ANGAN
MMVNIEIFYLFVLFQNTPKSTVKTPTIFLRETHRNYLQIHKYQRLNKVKWLQCYEAGSYWLTTSCLCTANLKKKDCSGEYFAIS